MESKKKVFMVVSILIAIVQGKTKMRVSVGGKLGESCEYDDDCDVNYSYCRAHQTCECKRGFESNPTRDKCMTTIGAVCSSSYDCSALINSECNQGVCSCKSGFVPHPSMKECLLAAALYEAACVEHIQCSTAFGDRITCIDGKCKCITKHHYADGMCIPSKDLGELCTQSKECHVSDIDASKNEKVECVAGRCECKISYHMSEDRATCTDGAVQIKSISLISVVLIIFNLIFC